MKRTSYGGWGVIATGLILNLVSVTSGQMSPVPSGPSVPAVPPAAVLMNPYLNPYLNPYTNPGAAQQRMTPGDAALFLYSAQAAGGGLGAGRLSGSRPIPTLTRTRPAEMPDASAVPGGGAARFFNPGPVNSNGAGRYYNRKSNYFQNNRR